MCPSCKIRTQHVRFFTRRKAQLPLKYAIKIPTKNFFAEHFSLLKTGLENILIFSKISKISDFFDIFDIFYIFYIFDIYRAFSHTWF